MNSPSQSPKLYVPVLTSTTMHCNKPCPRHACFLPAKRKAQQIAPQRHLSGSYIQYNVFVGASQRRLMGAKWAHGRIVGAGQRNLMGAWVRQNGCRGCRKSKNGRIFGGAGASQNKLMGAWVHEIMPWVQAVGAGVEASTQTCTSPTIFQNNN